MPDRQQIIEDTYIEPIRSVIAVDDEFPMLDMLLKNADEEAGDTLRFAWTGQTKQKTDNARRLLRLMRDWRRRKWIVDVHDGTGMGKVKDGKLDTQHLHQSDLVVLDYELRPEDRGEKSLSILQRLAKNPHFNLVIIYTKSPVEEAFRSVRRSLLRADANLSTRFEAEIARDWDLWKEDDESPAGRIFEQLANEDVYLNCRDRSRRSPAGFDWTSIRQLPLVQANLRDLGRWCGDKIYSAQDVIKWLLKEVERASAFEADNDETIGVLSWSTSPTPDLNWVRSDRIFVTVISKREDEDVDLIDRLKSALCDWSPTPVRLIVSQIRAQMEEYGGIIEEAALREHFTQAGWLRQILSTTKDAELEIRLSTMLERQTAALYKKLEPQVLPAAKDIIDAERTRNLTPDQVVDHHFYLGLSTEGEAREGLMRSMTVRLNTYECSIPVHGNHLTTGHILEQGGHFWICVTPACDLVPDQRAGEDTWREQIGTNLMPIKVVRLWPEKNEKKALESVDQGRHMFIDVDGKPLSFKFTESLGGNPLWEQWFAKSKGVFPQSGRKVTVLRLTKGNAGARAESKRKLHLAEHQGVKVVAQLRYEYALNLLHRMGANLSRVGLDFVGYKVE